MGYNIAVNGYGRIGRCVVRAIYESKIYRDQVNIVAINEMANNRAIYHLTKYDSTHGCFPGSVELSDNGLIINGDHIQVLQEMGLDHLPWKSLGIDVVFECTGVYKDRASAEKHLNAGAKKVIFSQPAMDEMDATIVYGINHQTLTSGDRIISNASCTTNCVIPILYTIDQTLGICKGGITTIHSAMHDQPVIDAYNQDLRKTRSALQSIIPVTTALDKGIGRIIPEFEGKFETLAIRVPTTNVSIMDITILLKNSSSKEEVNQILADASVNQLKGVLGVTSEELVSCDFNHDPRSAIIDLNQTRVSQEKLVKLQAWFDNEWGYSNRMLDTCLTAMAAD